MWIFTEEVDSTGFVVAEVEDSSGDVDAAKGLDESEVVG